MALRDLGRALEELWSDSPLPEGEPRLVCGRIVVVDATRSAVGGVLCALAWTVVTDPRTGRSVVLQRANDFLLESAEGRFAVRVAGWVPLVPDALRPERLGDEAIEALRAALEEAGLDPWHPLEFTEIVFREGDEVAVRGRWRREPAPAAVAVDAGFRDAPDLPTLSADLGRLEVELLVPVAGA